jgi:1-deoxy-D-xylulose 5-phosphate reductoisomerase
MPSWKTVERILDLERRVTHLETKDLEMSAESDDLRAEVAAQRDVVNSAVTLLAGLHARLDAAGTDRTALAALKTDLVTMRQELASAVAENTPVDPAVTEPASTAPEAAPVAEDTVPGGAV